MIINPIKRRKGKGITQVNIAPLLNVTQIYASQFETGRFIPSKNQIEYFSNVTMSSYWEVVSGYKNKLSKKLL